MNIIDIRMQLKKTSIFDIPLLVVIYVRVSTDSIMQLNSLNNQIQYYKDFIKRYTKWILVEIYVDEGISGISTKNRDGFNKMIKDAENGKFDLVITKEISRFARNTLDSIQYTRQLLSYGVGVFFQNDGINTFDDDSELRLTIMSSIAQDELRKLSSRVRFGQQQAIKNSVVLGNNRIFGYKKMNKRLVIDENEAPMVRELFEMYSTGKYSMKEIERVFWEKGYRNLKGNMISHTTMSNIISNPKYKGYYVGNKVKVVDMFTKKQKFLPPEEWVMFKDETGEIVPSIVSEEMWNKANEILRKRSEDVKNRQGISNHVNLLTGKLFCTNCGTPYYRKATIDKNGKENSKWVCSGKVKNGGDSCDSFAIFESEIIPIIYETFKNTKDVSYAMIQEYEELYRSLIGDGKVENEIKSEEEKIRTAKKKKEKLLDLVTEGNITNIDFRDMSARCNEEIERAKIKIIELKDKQSSSEEFHEHMLKVRSALRAAEKDVSNGTITREFIDSFIDKIFVTPESENCMRLDIRIFTGDSTESYLEKLRSQSRGAKTEEKSEGRMGHTSKKMIEAYEKNMK